MISRKELICRLCLKVKKTEFKVIDQTIKQMFDFLSLKLDLNVIRNGVICWDCVEVAKKHLAFKSTCFDTERRILLLSIGRRNSHHNTIDIYEGRENVVGGVYEDLCQICMTRLERDSFVSSGALLNSTVFEILSEYVPEVDVHIIKDPIFCTTCRKTLLGYFKFVQNNLGIEEKIKEYCTKEGTDSMGQIRLSNVVNFLFKNTMKYPDEFSQTCKSKQEPNLFEDQCVNSKIHSEFIKLGHQLDIKGENTNLQTIMESISNNKDTLVAASKCKVKNNVKGRKVYKCSLCAYEAKQKSHFNSHMLIHKDVSEIKMYKCSLCAYEAKRKHNLEVHMLVHKDFSEIRNYKCSFCGFETKQNSHLNRHMLVHKDISEIKMYKCSLCAYEAKQKWYINRHMLVHKDVSDIKMYKCSLCAYKVKQKNYLNRHMLVHKDVSEINMFKCSLCAYEAKRKDDLKRHSLVHKNNSRIKV